VRKFTAWNPFSPTNQHHANHTKTIPFLNDAHDIGKAVYPQARVESAAGLSAASPGCGSLALLGVPEKKPTMDAAGSPLELLQRAGTKIFQGNRQSL
jgi:hypothetical protein